MTTGRMTNHRALMSHIIRMRIVTKAFERYDREKKKCCQNYLWKFHAGENISRGITNVNGLQYFIYFITTEQNLKTEQQNRTKQNNHQLLPPKA